VIAGEDANDRKALRVVLEASCPDMRGRLVEINSSVRLHQATGERLKQRVSTLYQKAKARAARERAELACIFVHEDWDQIDSDEWAAAGHRVQQALDAAARRSHYVLAVWEVEAWLLLFPKALTSVVSTWSVPSRYAGRDTGRLNDPKRILQVECSKRGRRYHESDAVAVLQAAAANGELAAPAGRNRSWTQLRAHIDGCCLDHIGRRRP
jgi:hypothetical protein